MIRDARDAVREAELRLVQRYGIPGLNNGPTPLGVYIGILDVAGWVGGGGRLRRSVVYRYPPPNTGPDHTEDFPTVGGVWDSDP